MSAQNPDNSLEKDQAADIAAKVKEAYTSAAGLNISGGGSKSFLVNAPEDGVRNLDVTGHAGVISYEPTELVVSARCGTRISDLRAVLAERGQYLPFDPPSYGVENREGSNASDTLGGVIACGVSGPARPYLGAARDFMLGVRLINGKGEDLKFGGEVMKNVAGYDVSRLQVGACGSLGVLLDISLKVLPMPELSETREFEMTAGEALVFLQGLARKPLPLSGASITPAQVKANDVDALVDDSMPVLVRVRFSGSAAAVASAAGDAGGEVLQDESVYWRSLRDLTHDFFASCSEGARLWRMTLPEATTHSALANALPGLTPADVLIDWGGGLRWVKSAAQNDVLTAAASKLGGQVQACTQPGNSLHKSVGQTRAWYGERLALASSGQTMNALQQGIKKAFDPANILNPGVFGYR